MAGGFSECHNSTTEADSQKKTPREAFVKEKRIFARLPFENAEGVVK
jgi:hypothetical protein